jgi:hypothetical protein
VGTSRRFAIHRRSFDQEGNSPCALENSVSRGKNVVLPVAIGAALLASAAEAQSAAGTDATAQAIAPIRSCDIATMQAAPLVSDYPTFAFTNPPNDTSVTVVSVSTTTNGGIPVCIVNLLVKAGHQHSRRIADGRQLERQAAVRRRWRLRGVGWKPVVHSPRAMSACRPTPGHTGGSGTFGCVNDCAGATQATPGSADKQRQIDFIVRSEHLMAVLGKQLANYFTVRR